MTVNVRAGIVPDHVRAWGRFVVRANNKVSANKRHKNVPPTQLPELYGLIGTLEGWFNSLAHIPCDGTLSISISAGSHEFVGNIRVYDESGRIPLQRALHSIDEIGQRLSRERGIVLVTFRHEQSVEFKPMQ